MLTGGRLLYLAKVDWMLCGKNERLWSIALKMLNANASELLCEVLLQGGVAT